MTEVRCSKCKRFLGKLNGELEIKCPRCNEINKINTNVESLEPQDK